MQWGKRLTLKDYFAKHTRTHKNHKNTNVELLLSTVKQVQLFLDNMVLANQNAKLTSPDQGFLVSSSYKSPGNAVGVHLLSVSSFIEFY
jgi:uncharacterized protein YbcV (DUF1398 family)